MTMSPDFAEALEEATDIKASAHTLYNLLPTQTMLHLTVIDLLRDDSDIATVRTVVAPVVEDLDEQISDAMEEAKSRYVKLAQLCCGEADSSVQKTEIEEATRRVFEESARLASLQVMRHMLHA